MMKTDYHMHTRFSSDSDADPEKMIQRSIELGLESICITDHQDLDFPKMNDKEALTFELDTDSYVEHMLKLQKKYENQIQVRIGVEIGLQKHLGTRYHQYVQEYPFDFVIGSLHLLYNKDPYYPETFHGKTDEEAYHQAFVDTLEGITHIEDFDVLGHLDYIVRYGKSRAEQYSYRKYADEIDEILKYIIEHGKGIEINTSGFKYGLGFAHPHPDVIKRYRELGGEIITVGADGHKPEHIAYDFQKVNSILKDCGFKYYTEFSKRQPIFKQL